jgi:hypothetical protein
MNMIKEKKNTEKMLILMTKPRGWRGNEASEVNNLTAIGNTQSCHKSR